MPTLRLAVLRSFLPPAHAPPCLAARLPWPQELLEKCNPLGMFDAIASLAVAQNMRDLYRLVRHTHTRFLLEATRAAACS